MGGKGKGGGKGGKGKHFGKSKGKGEGGKSPPSELHTAAREGDVEKIQELLKDVDDEQAINVPDHYKRTPLHMAAFSGKAAAVKALLDLKADVQKQAMDGFLSLHFAAQQGHLEVIQTITRHLSEGGAPGSVKKHVNKTITKGAKSALHLALEKNHPDCAKFLALKGSSLEAKTASGQSALALAQSDELKSELQVAGRKHQASDFPVADSTEAPEAAAADDEEENEEPAPKRQAIGEAKPEPKPVGGAAPTSLPPLIAAKIVAASEATSSSTPLCASLAPLAKVEVNVSQGDRSYPAGTSEVADNEWTLALDDDPTLLDGTVYSLTARDGPSADGALKLTIQRSTYKMLFYTHLSDGGSAMASDAKCNALALSLIPETTDGVILLSSSKDQPLLGPAVPISIVTSSDLPALATALLRKASLDCTSLEFLGLYEVPEKDGESHRHELVVRAKLTCDAKVAQAALSKGAPDKTIALVSRDDHPEATPLEKILEDHSKLSTGTHRALLLLEKL